MQRLFLLLDVEYNVTGDLGGNGCKHGFKPASECPNPGCDAAELDRLWREFFKEVYE